MDVDTCPFCSYLHIHVFAAALIHVEVDDFWTEASLHLDVHLVAGLHQLLGQVHVISWKAVVGTEGQNTRQKTHQVVLKERTHSPNQPKYQEDQVRHTLRRG